MMHELAAGTSGGMDWLSPSISFGSLVVSTIALAVTLRRGRRVRAVISIDRGQSLVRVYVNAGGTSAVQVRSWGFLPAEKRYHFRMPPVNVRGKMEVRPRHGEPSVPCQIEAGCGIQLSADTALVAELPGPLVYGWVETATRRRLVLTDPLRIKTIRDAAGNPSALPFTFVPAPEG